MVVVGAAAPAFCAVRLLVIPLNSAWAASNSSGSVVRNAIYAPSCSKVAIAGGKSTLCVRVTAPVRWRKANNPCPHIPDRKGPGDSRLRLLNEEARSFNKLLPGEIEMSPALGQQPRRRRAARG